MDKFHFSLSNFGKASTTPSPINKMTQNFATDFRPGIDINLGVGYVNDDTTPNNEILDAMEKVLSNKDKYKNALNYGGAEGSKNLHDSIRNYYLRNKIGSLTESDFKEKRILIGPNGATSILESFADIVKPGIVITTDPMYYIYCETLLRKGFKLITIPEDHHGIRVDLLKEKLKQININDLSFIYIVSVSNPSSVILSNDRKLEIVQIFEELSIKRKILIPLIFDKAYEDIIHNPEVEKPVSGLKYNSIGNVFEIGTLSKVLAPALRIGYMIGFNNNLMTLLVQKFSDIGFSAPLINQEIASYLLDTHIEKQIIKVNNGYREKSIKLKNYITKHLGKYLEDIKGGDAGFYFYLHFKDIQTNEKSDFFKYLARTTGKSNIDGESEKHPRLIYIPGEHCNNPDGTMVSQGKKELRISYGFEEMENLYRSIELIKEAAAYSIKNN